MGKAAPGPTLLLDSNADRAAWLAARRTGIGASDAPGILGISPFASPLSIAAAKLGLAPTGDDAVSELQRWGHYVEAPMIAAYAAETGRKAEPSGKLYRSTQKGHEYQLATLDGVVQRDDGKLGVIECKLKIFGSSEWERDGVPEHVQAQGQHAAQVMGWDFFVVIGLLDGYRLRHREFARNDAWLGDILDPAEREFWRQIQRGDPIDATLGAIEASALALKRLHPSDDGRTIHLEGQEWIDRRRAWLLASEAAKASEAEKQRAKLALVQALGSATYATLDDGTRLSLKTTTRAGYTVAETTFRTLRDAAPKAKR